MLNLETITTATIAQLRDFCKSNNVAVLGDLRLKATWFDAAYQLLKAQAVAAAQAVTSPEARALYKSAFRFVCKTIVVLCLAAIVLGILTRELCEMFWGWLNVQLEPSPRTVAIKIFGRIVTRSVFAAARCKSKAQILLDRAMLQVQSARSAVIWNALQVKYRALNARAALLH
ncbi:hypothetical protein NIES2135_20750 [Leptolyngbya boryana NIES-2135]|uniref:SSD domain-containing protein n=2 Tax=Leptolyngbya group TaxID=3081713 RepID=A0A1Z4JEQ8_LEPBY|nr:MULTISPECIES: hypothetical protein [Leptolyngbya]MBD2406595.1 hypothetical protein [Leptolyngbya sp. FACHB-402]BAS59918.1 hypothetical protein LBWT_A0880 [Leptolyngbya boryana IAM M-101]BAS66266.1 hypothetical protein LBDG_A0880 [Leptolyngbya boryana dg5]BAY55252.1 hypothetical protein NIES2135_20750 [Leptolyngbya boryana NIES-2135]